LDRQLRHWRSPLSSIFSDEYRRALKLLVQVRKRAGVTQQQLAKKLARPQSFVSKYERGERRLDVVEFLRISRLLDADPVALLREIDERSV
jgi:transcriptional regulator with XRE-family HTH domain